MSTRGSPGGSPGGSSGRERQGQPGGSTQPGAGETARDRQQRAQLAQDLAAYSRRGELLARQDAWLAGHAENDPEYERILAQRTLTAIRYEENAARVAAVERYFGTRLGRAPTVIRPAGEPPTPKGSTASAAERLRAYNRTYAQNVRRPRERAARRAAAVAAAGGEEAYQAKRARQAAERALEQALTYEGQLARTRARNAATRSPRQHTPQSGQSAEKFAASVRGGKAAGRLQQERAEARRTAKIDELRVKLTRAREAEREAQRRITRRKQNSRYYAAHREELLPGARARRAAQGDRGRENTKRWKAENAERVRQQDLARKARKRAEQRAARDAAQNSGA